MNQQQTPNKNAYCKGGGAKLQQVGSGGLQQNIQLNKKLQGSGFSYSTVPHSSTNKSYATAKRFTMIQNTLDQQMKELQLLEETTKPNEILAASSSHGGATNHQSGASPQQVKKKKSQEEITQNLRNQRYTASTTTNSQAFQQRVMLPHNFAQSLENSVERQRAAQGQVINVYPGNSQKYLRLLEMEAATAATVRNSVERQQQMLGRMQHSQAPPQKYQRVNMIAPVAASVQQPRHPSRGHNQNNGTPIQISNLLYNQQPCSISPFYPADQQQTIQQYSSIPVKMTATKPTRASAYIQHGSAGVSSLGGINPMETRIKKQASALMKMYGGSRGATNKAALHYSIERTTNKVTSSTTKSGGGGAQHPQFTNQYQMYHQPINLLQKQQQMLTQSNSKLSTSFCDDQHQRKSLGIAATTSLNHSLIAPHANIYDSASGSLQHLTSLESYRAQFPNFQIPTNSGQLIRQSGVGVGIRNMQSQTTYNKFKVKSHNMFMQQQMPPSINEQSNSHRKNPLSKTRVSSKNVIRRFQQQQQSAILSSLNTQYPNNSSSSLINSNLYIQQNEQQDQHGPGIQRFRTNVRSSGATITTQSARNNKEKIPETVMYLKQQEELLSLSQGSFQEGKQCLVSKNYKEAINLFTKALKSNQSNHEAKYYRAICYLDSEQPQKCIQDLNELLDVNFPNQTIYVVLSIAYRRLNNDLSNALRILSKGLQKHPKYVEAYMARGQINIYMKKFDKALLDFQKVIQLQPQNGQGYIGQADSMKGIGNFKGALQAYNQALQIDGRVKNQGIFKRGLLLYQLKNYDQSLSDFDYLLNENDKNARAHYYKGKILKKQLHENEAILHFEQVIKNTQSPIKENSFSPNRLNNNDQSIDVLLPHTQQTVTTLKDEELAGNALFEIAKIRITQKDFYEAFHNLQRALHYDFKSRKFVQYKMFVEGVLLLMKRKVKKGVRMLSQIEGVDNERANAGAAASCSPRNRQLAVKTQEVPPLKNEFLHLIYVYRSYGYIILQQLDKALQDLSKAAKIKKLEESCIYNKFVCQALIKIDKTKDLTGVISILQQAEAKFPMNKDPYKYQAVCLVQGVLNDLVDIDNPKKKQAVLDATVILNRALLKFPKDTNLLYLRGLLLFYLHQFYDALIDLDAVIDLDDEPTAKHYLARGRCHACLSMFQEAIADLSKAIELDEELSDAYFNRGKCAYLLGDTALAFLDFQKLILLEPKNPMVHIYAGNLLMTTGSYDDATKAFTNADSVQKSALAFYQRSRCNIALANLDQALKDLNLVVERSPQDKIAYVDRECLNALKQAITATQTVQNELSSQTKQGYDISTFEKGAVVFTKLLNAGQYDIENNVNASISAIRQHQQIIPNVKRIKLEKVRALRRKRLKDEQFGIPGMKRSKKPKGPFYPPKQDPQDIELAHQAEKIEPFSYYKENIFGQEDFYLYRGVMHFYICDYQKAISDFEQSISSKQEQKDSDNNGDTMSQGSNQTDLSDVGLCSLNVHECQYNIVLCLIMQRDFKSALDKVSRLIHEAPKRYTKYLYLIRGLLYQALGNTGKSKGDLDVFQKFCSQEKSALYSEYMELKNSISLAPFPLGTRLCQQFPEIRISIPNAPTYLYARPSFSFPFVKPPNMIPNVEESVLTSEFSLNTAAAMKPEAPWIKRCDFGGIKFTDEIQIIDSSKDGGEQDVTETEDVMTNTTNKEDDEDDIQETPPHHYQDGDYPRRLQLPGDADESLDERHYLRNYIREYKRRTEHRRAYSEQHRSHQAIDLIRDEDDDDEQYEDQAIPDEDGDEQMIVAGDDEEHDAGARRSNSEGSNDKSSGEEGTEESKTIQGQLVHSDMKKEQLSNSHLSKYQDKQLPERGSSFEKNQNDQSSCVNDEVLDQYDDNSNV